MARIDSKSTSKPPFHPGPALTLSREQARFRLPSDLIQVFTWALALNLPLVATGQVWHSWDFPTHVFLASHYQRTWWSLWEPRWLEGFNVASYPPLTHQLAALAGWVIGDDNAVNLLTGASVIAFPIAIYRLALVYFGPRIARRAAAVAVVTPSVLLAAYAFGQLPTLFALDASLFAAAELRPYFRRGDPLRLAMVLTLVGSAVASHHATAIFFLPPLLATVCLVELLESPVSANRLRRVAVALFGTVTVVGAVIFPFWVWHATEYVSQLPIDHQSRHNLLSDIIAQDLFFWAEHGVLVAGLVVVVPLFRRVPRSIAPWYVLAVFLLLLGLGGTTPLPELVFGSQWEWLTYDRFSLWADVPLVLLFGAAATRVLDVAASRQRWASLAWRLTLGLLGVYSLLGALTPALIQTEPKSIDPRPIVAFLAQDNRDQWRYLTLGFGDQNGILNAETSAGTIDGAFFTARRVPQLSESGIGQIDYSFLWDSKARLLRALLDNPAPHSLRWVFTSDVQYERLLAEYNWSIRETRSNGVRVWESPRQVPPVSSTEERNGILGVWWGIAPLATFVSAGLVAWRLTRRDRLPPVEPAWPRSAFPENG